MIIRATNSESITKLLNLENLWDDMLEDGNIKEVSSDKNTWYLAILTENLKPAGVAIAQWLGNNLITWHFGLFKKYRGPDSVKYGFEVKNFINTLKSDIKHITIIPEYKESAIKYAQKLGFKEKTRITKSIKKNSKLYDRILMEI